MRSFILYSLLLVPLFSGAQECNCLDEFHFIKSHIEKNHGGFNKKIKSPAEPRYKNFSAGIEKKIRGLTDNKYCIVWLKKYILYLKDHHSNITDGGEQAVREDSLPAVEAFLRSPAYRNAELIQWDSVKIAGYLKNSTDSIEGIYHTADGTYRVALLKNPTPYRDYAAIILQSTTRLWTMGQVKFEIKKINDSLAGYYYYLRNHASAYDEFALEKGRGVIPGWEKWQPVTTPSKIIPISNDIIRFSILDDRTSLLSIRSFSSSFYSILDSAYKKVIPEIMKYPYLIIDVRNNGGGADFCYGSLLPLLYTDTIYSDVVEIYNTPGNAEAYRKFNELSVKNGNPAVFARSLFLMSKAKSYTFIPMGSSRPSANVLPVNKGNPVKIAILYNRGCASSCESLLFNARYSKKTLLVGENSGGFTGYGDVMSLQTPCGNNLNWTTTVYRNQWKYELVGIPPKYRVPVEETDWVDYTRRLLEK
jgi:Peptidase family S41